MASSRQGSAPRRRVDGDGQTAAGDLTQGAALLALAITGASLIYLSLAASPLVFTVSLAVSWIVLRPSLGIVAHASSASACARPVRTPTARTAALRSPADRRAGEKQSGRAYAG